MASVDVLFEGYAHDRVAGTVSCLRDDGVVAVVDPGMVPSRAAILDPLTKLGVSAAEVTDVDPQSSPPRSHDQHRHVRERKSPRLLGDLPARSLDRSRR